MQPVLVLTETEVGFAQKGVLSSQILNIELPHEISIFNHRVSLEYGAKYTQEGGRDQTEKKTNGANKKIA